MLTAEHILGRLGGSVVYVSSFGSGRDLTVSSSSVSGSMLTAQGLDPASDSVSPSLSAPPPLAVCLSVSQK